jgi:hypothetical protein
MSKCVRSGAGRRVLDGFDGKLAGYLAATGAIGAGLAHQSQAAVVSNTTVQPFGINGTVSIDFNSDNQIDFQIDHDRVNLNGNNLDYLQIDKNDVNGENNPLDTDPLPNFAQSTFPVNGTVGNNDSQVLSFTNDFGDLGGYAVALKAGDKIGGAFAELNGSYVAGTIRANRLVDEDAGQIDANAGRSVTQPFGTQPVYPDLDDFLGLNGEVRYLGLRVDLNDAAQPGLNANNPTENPNFHEQFWYGWLGVRIANEADATGEVVGWGYETEVGVPILAGDVGIPTAVLGDYNGNNVVDAADYTVWRDGGPLLNEGASPGVIDQEDYNFWKTHFGDVPGGGGVAGSAAVPEPGSMAMAAICGGLLIGRFVVRKLFGMN